MATIPSATNNDHLLALLHELGVEDSEELRQTLLEHGNGSLAHLPELIPVLQSRGLINTEQLRGIRDFAQSVRSSCNTSISQLTSPVGPEDSKPKRSRKEEVYNDDIRDSWSISWHIRLLQKFEQIPFVAFEYLQALVMVTHGTQAMSLWVARGLCLLVFAAATLFFAWPDAEQIEASNSNARVAEEEAEPVDSRQLNVSPILGLLDQGQYSEALEASKTLAIKSNSHEFDRTLLETALEWAQGAQVDNMSIMKLLIQDSRFNSQCWRHIYAVWLLESTGKSRDTMLSFLSASNAGDSWTRFRMKAWLNSREGDASYALRYLNQVEDLKAEDADLLFRARSSLQSQDFRGALLDLNSLRSQLEIQDNAGLSSSAKLEDVLATLCREKIRAYCDMLHENATNKTKLPSEVAEAYSLTDTLTESLDNPTSEQPEAEEPAVFGTEPTDGNETENDEPEQTEDGK
ncbi:MAG: hypothetical protein AAF483_08300 [Planctomycetota bacterium]